MCCFSLPSAGALRVSGTRIFARHLSEQWQGLAYELTLTASSEVAMILPLPVRPGAGEGGVEFIDLSGYKNLFKDLAEGFPVVTRSAPRARSLLPLARPTLKVHRVGAFDASFVPTVRDFDRLDARFRLPEAAWEQLPQVADCGFAVFKLRGGRRQAVHPMGLRFQRRPGEPRLFFPTVHIHDGKVHPRAGFDHTLYAQGRQPEDDWEESYAAAAAFMDPERAQGLVDGSAHVVALELHGRYVNSDTWL